MKEYFRERDMKEAFEERWAVVCDYSDKYQSNTATFELSEMGREVLPLVESKMLEEDSVNGIKQGAKLFSALAEEEDRQRIVNLLLNPNIYEKDFALDPLLRTLNRLNKELRKQKTGADELEESWELLKGLLNIYYGSPEADDILVAMGMTGNRDVEHYTGGRGRHTFSYDMAVRVARDADSDLEFIVGKDYFNEPLQYFYPDLLDGNLEEKNFDFFMRRAQAIVEFMPDLEPTIKESAMLYAFNYLRTHKKIDREWLIERIRKFSCNEKKYKESIFPSEGIEIEIPSFSVDELHQRLIHGYGISHYNEGEDLYEVNKSFSYSPSAQSRIIEELIKMRALPLVEEEVNGEYAITVPEKIMLSVHLNFGIPAEIEDVLEEKYSGEVDLLVDAITFAFVTPRRIEKRKSTGFSWTISEDDVVPNGKTGRKRLEIKIPEFRDMASFRMIDESQALTSAMYCYVKQRRNLKLSLTEARLAELWKMFRMNMRNIENRYGMSPAIYNNNVKEAAEFARNSYLKGEIRYLVDLYSCSIKNAVFGEEE